MTRGIFGWFRVVAAGIVFVHIELRGPPAPPVQMPPRISKLANSTAADQHSEQLRLLIQPVFHELGIAPTTTSLSITLPKGL
jgi:hypothetical protein